MVKELKEESSLGCLVVLSCWICLTITDPDVLFIAYRIARNFRGRKLMRIGWKKIFMEKTFTDCLLVPPKDATSPNFVNSHKKLNSFLPWKFPAIRYLSDLFIYSYTSNPFIFSDIKDADSCTWLLAMWSFVVVFSGIALSMNCFVYPLSFNVWVTGCVVLHYKYCSMTIH